MKVWHHKYQVWLTLFLCVALLPPISEAQQRELERLNGKWRVTGVRLDETLSRTPAYNIDDPELMGRVISVSATEIRTNMPGVKRCGHPAVKSEITTIDTLVKRTMGRGTYTMEQPNKFRLPVETSKQIPVLWVTCGEGHLGPDTPFGPEGYNWIARLSDNRLAMRWHDNTIILLKREGTAQKLLHRSP